MNVSSRKALSRQREGLLERFDSRVLRDLAHDVDDGDDLVIHLAEGVGASETATDVARDRTDRDLESDPVRDSALTSATMLEDALGERLHELMAEACAWLLAEDEADEYLELRDDQEVEAARSEALEFLQDNLGVAESIGVLDDVEDQLVSNLLVEDGGQA